MRLSALTLMTSVVAAQASAGADQHEVAEHLVRIGAGVGRPKATTMPTNDSSRPSHCDRMEMIAGNEPARSDHDKERRQIEKQRAARRRRPNQAAIDQQEFEREQHAGQNSGGERAVALEQRNAAHLRPGADQQRRDRRTRRRLDQRRNIVDRELDRDIVEAPAQTKPDSHRDGERVERAGRGDGCARLCDSMPRHHRSRQCEQMPAISISGLLGEKPAARDDALSASAAAPPGASPTAPQRSQIRKTTRSSAVVIVHASDESVAALDAMDETVVAQKIERAIDRDRRRPVLVRQPLDDLVGAERLVARQQRFQHLAAHRRQPLRARRALRFGMRDRRAGAALVIVVGRRENRAQCIRHAVTVSVMLAGIRAAR